MVKIIIKGIAETDFKDLQELDGIDCPDEFVEYLDEYHDKTGTLKPKLISGYLSFKFEQGKLYSITEYTANELLTTVEAENLMNYTQGQWSDGIGEGFEQHPCCEINGEEVFISPWHNGQELDFMQEALKNS